MLNNFIRFKAQKKELIFLGVIILIYFAQKLLSFKLGIYMEECRDANAHLAALNGQLPYKHSGTWSYGPFAFWVYPLVFKIFGTSLLSLRLGYIVISSLVIPLVYYLARRLMPSLWAGLAAFLSIVLIDVPYYTYNHILATVAGLSALLLFFRFIEGNSSNSTLFFIGIFIGIALLVKPFFMGLTILFSIFLFMFFLKVSRIATVNISFSHSAILGLGAFSALAPFLIYFLTQGSLYELFTHMTPIGPHRASAYYFYSDSPLPPIINYWRYASEIIPYKIIFSPLEWKTVLVRSYERLILFSPLLFPTAILLLNRFIFRKHNLISKNAGTYFILFLFFSLSISFQSLICLRQMGRSFTMQVPFILISYFLFLVNLKELYPGKKALRYTVTALSAGFILYLSFLHFFRYPYSRSKKYIAPLELARAQGIKVTPEEKELFESLHAYLSQYPKQGQPIGILGHCPTLSFLSERENIFNGETIIYKLRYLVRKAASSLGAQQALRGLEDYLIAKLMSKQPEFILEPIIFGREYAPTRFHKYIYKTYALEKTFGPAEIDIYSPGLVKVYRLRQ